MSVLIRENRDNYWMLNWLDKFMEGHKGFICGGCFYVFLSPLLVMVRLPPRCRQVKNMAFVITIIPHLQWFLLLSLVFQPTGPVC